MAWAAWSARAVVYVVARVAINTAVTRSWHLGMAGRERPKDELRDGLGREPTHDEVQFELGRRVLRDELGREPTDAEVAERFPSIAR